ncbi:spore germination protein [Paenibacillus silvisoli]|uniref:spore germination protein n=1 Tax=Paenibacillus silvisoli TaxID=3110539 RepID=UPI002803CDDF|nr:spore germination protein [Paenibacillus silvisoli]
MRPISKSIETNETYLREQFQHCSDIIFRSFTLRDEAMLLLIYLDGMTKVQSIEDNVLKPLLFNGLPQGLDRVQSLAELFRREWLPLTNVATDDKMDDLVNHILQGIWLRLLLGHAY